LMPEQLDLFSSVSEQEQSPVEKASAMLMERRLRPPAVIMQSHQPEIVVPRFKEQVEEKIIVPVENKLKNETAAELPSAIPDQSSETNDKIENIQNRLEVINEDDNKSPESVVSEIPTPEIVRFPSTEISEIANVPVAVISEPIAIITVKPIEEEKPKTARGRKSIKEMSMEADLPQVPEDEKLFSKQYYGIGEVAIMFQVNASLLRYWETEFDVLKPKKNGKGDRFFRPEDIKNLQIIHHLLRQKKFTIQGAKDYLKNNKQSKEKFEMVKQLQQLRSFLLEMKAGL
jgi:DNA-binding transcriptional MerR regulator